MYIYTHLHTTHLRQSWAMPQCFQPSFQIEGMGSKRACPCPNVGEWRGIDGKYGYLSMDRAATLARPAYVAAAAAAAHKRSPPHTSWISASAIVLPFQNVGK